MRPVILHGHNPDIDVADVPEALWKVGGTYNWVTSSSTLTASSSSANDAAAGTGARTITIYGLDSDYNEISETITMNGVSSVATTQSFFRVNKAAVASAGTGQTNAGNITIQSGGTTVEYIAASYSISESLHYTVPANHTLFSAYERINIVKKAADATALVDPKEYNATTGIWTKLPEIEVFSSAGPTQLTFTELSTIGVPEKIDLDWEVSFTSTNDLAVTARLSFILVHNSMIKKYIK